MILSMTGYGESEIPYKRSVIRCRLKSVNGRGAKAKVQGSFLPLSALHLIEKTIVKSVGRGEVIARFSMEAELGGEEQKLIESVQKTAERLSRVKAALRIDDAVTMRDVMEFHRVFPLQEAVDEDAGKEIYETAMVVVTKALAELSVSRETEGGRLKQDLEASLAVIEEKVRRIEELEGRVQESFKERIKDSLAEADVGDVVSEERVTAELVLLADRCDIHEELVRMKSHLALFRETLGGEADVVGKKLDFFGQEMFREISTLVGKARDAEVSRHAVTVKDHLGRLREQLRNVL